MTLTITKTRTETKTFRVGVLEPDVDTGNNVVDIWRDPTPDDETLIVQAILEKLTPEQRHEVWETEFPRATELLEERDGIRDLLTTLVCHVMGDGDMLDSHGWSEVVEECGEVVARMIAERDRLRAQAKDSRQHLDAVAAALHDWDSPEGHTYTPEQLPGMVARLRAQAETEAKHRNALQQDLNHITARLQAIADTTCGPFEAMSADESMSQIKGWLAKLTRERDAAIARAERAERERDEARGELTGMTTQRNSYRKQCHDIDAVLDMYATDTERDVTRVSALERILRRLVEEKRAGFTRANAVQATVDAWRPVVEAAAKARSRRMVDLGVYMVTPSKRLAIRPDVSATEPPNDSDLAVWLAVDALPPEHRPKQSGAEMIRQFREQAPDALDDVDGVLARMGREPPDPTPTPVADAVPERRVPRMP